MRVKDSEKRNASKVRDCSWVADSGRWRTNLESESRQTVESKTFIRTLLTLVSSSENHLLCEVFLDTPRIQPLILSIPT